MNVRFLTAVVLIAGCAVPPSDDAVRPDVTEDTSAQSPESPDEAALEFTAQPSCASFLPGTALIGQEFAGSVTISNTGDTTGFVPSVEFLAPTGLAVTAARSLGQSTRLVRIGTCDDSPLVHPVTGETYSCAPGNDAWFAQSALSGQPVGGPPVDIEVTFRLPSDAVLGDTFAISAQCTYMLGTDAVNNPATDPPLRSAATTGTVTAAVWTLSHAPSQPAIVTGKKWPFSFVATLDVANGATVTGAFLREILPPGFHLDDIDIDGDGDVVDVNLAPTYVVLFPSLVGGPGDADATVTFKGWFEEHSSPGVPLIDPDTGTPVTATASATITGFVPSPEGPVLMPPTHQDASIEAAAILVRETVVNQTRPGEGFRTEDRGRVDIDVDVSDFFCFDPVVVESTVGDGVTVRPNSLQPNGSTTSGTGPTLVTLPFGEMDGCRDSHEHKHGEYQFDVDATYEGGGNVLGNDVVDVSEQVTGTIEGTATDVVDDEVGTGGDGRVPMGGVVFQKTLAAVNGSATVSPANVRNGDVITWRLVADVRAGALDGLVLEDFLPTPLFDAQEHGVSPIVGAAASPDPIRFGPTNTLPIGTSITVATTPASGTNAVTFTIGAFTNPGDDVMVDLLLDFTVIDTVVEDGLVLTNVATSAASGSDVTTTSVGSAGVVAREPRLVIEQGLSLLRLGEPTPSLAGLDAGDTFTTSIRVTNEGGATAHEVTLTAQRDPAQQAPLSGSNVVVTDESGTPIAVTGDLFGAGLVIPLLQAVPSANEVVVKYDSVLTLASETETTQTVTATLTRYGAVDAGADFAEPDVSVQSTVRVAPFAYAVTRPGPSDRTIGETSQYLFTVTVPEGTHDQVVLTATLPPELALVAAPAVVASPGLTATATPAITNSGRSLVLDFGTVVNSNTNNAVPETIRVTSDVVVLNNTQSNRSDQLTTSTSLTTQTGAPLSGTTPIVKILETGLRAAITMNPNPADGGDSVVVTIAVTRLLDTIAVHDVSDVITLPPLVTNVHDAVAVSGTPPTNLSIAGTLVTASWTTLPAGATSTWRVTGDVPSNAVIGVTATVTSNLTWTSLPGSPAPISAFNPESTERTGTGSPAFNDYKRTDTGQLQIAMFGLSMTRESPETRAVFDVARYRATLRVPEGADDDTHISLELPLGLVFASNNLSSFSSALTCNGGPCQLTNDNLTLSADRRVATWSLGRLENHDVNNATSETIATTFNVVVSNVSAASRGALLIPKVTVKSISAVAPPTRVIEPTLSALLVKPTAPFDAGDVLPYSITLTHALESDATLYVVTGTLDMPPGIEAQPGSAGVGCTPVFGALDPTKVTFTLARLDPGATCQITFSGRAVDDLPPGTRAIVISTFRWQSLPGDATTPPAEFVGLPVVPRSGFPTNPGGSVNLYGRSGSATVTSTDAAITKALVSTDQALTADPAVALGERATWALTVTVPEGGSPATVVTDTPPEGMAVVDVALDDAGFGGTVGLDPTGPVAGVSGEAVAFDLGLVTNPPDGSANNDTLTIVVTTEAVFDPSAYVATSHPQVATLTVDGTERDESVVESGLVLGGLVIRIAADDDAPEGGQEVMLTASVENLGTGPACTPEVVVSFPPQIPPEDPSADGVDNDRDGSTDEADEAWSITALDVVIPKTTTGAPCLDPGEARSWDLVGTVQIGAGDDHVVASARLVSWESLDTAAAVTLDPRSDSIDSDDNGQIDEPADDITSIPLDVAVPGLVATKVAADGDADFIEPNDTITWTVTVHNAGDGTAHNVAVEDTIDVANQAVSAASVVASQGTVDTSGFPHVTANLGTLAPDASATLAFTGVIGPFVPAHTTISNQAAITQSLYAPLLSDDPAVPGVADPTVIVVAATDNPDGDCLTNAQEAAAGTDPNDVDSDEDGISDCDELDGTGPLAAFAATDPTLADTDGDGLQDGTEVGLAVGLPSTDPLVFQPDEETASKTDPNDADFDDDGLLDGQEDADADGAQGIGETDPADDDSDFDGVQDGTELGVTTGHADTGPTFVPDDDPSRTTDPLDDDTDDDGLSDGTEDANGDGRANNTIGGTGTPGSGETSPSRRDTDGDGLQDGQEAGLDGSTLPAGTNTDRFTPDTDPLTTTNPLDTDTDDGGVNDGLEDVNHNGAVDRSPVGCTPGTLACELDPEVTADDGTVLDDDDDGLTNDDEAARLTDPLDWDTDDDGLSDGEEVTGAGVLGGTITDPLLQDSDGDGLTDGQEAGLETPVQTDATHPLDATDPALFVPDADGTTTTDPSDDDTDDDLLLDGEEDANLDGALDAAETDPADDDTDHDRIEDGTESVTDPLDDDSDDDGLLDGIEAGPDGIAAIVIGGTGSTGGFELDPNDPDTDHDGIPDGIEVGLTAPMGTGTVGFVPDADPSTRTHPSDTDTDDGGLADGLEDVDHDGALDAGETNPRDPSDDATVLDSDLDGLVDADEDLDADGLVDPGESDPFDADTDDDGLTDDLEVLGNGVLLIVTDPRRFDTDRDGLSDGQEQGVDTITTVDTLVLVFEPDADPLTRTDPLDADTDDDALADGVEDINRDGAFDAGEVDPDNVDTDHDGLQDGTERGVFTPTADTDLAVFQPDLDPAHETFPLDADTDDDGLLDGQEDANHDGATVNTIGGTGTSGTGEADPILYDTDHDGLPDGLERNAFANTLASDPGRFTPDLDPESATDALDTDTDDGGVPDGVEDANHNGAVDAGELDPEVGADDVFGIDSDGDTLSDGDEDADHDHFVDPTETDPNDRDTDNDGLRDDVERFALSGYAPTDPTLADTDGDGLQDGTEQRLDAATDLHTNPLAFVPDADPLTGTDPLDADTDDDGLVDGDEDTDGDGARALHETDPERVDTDTDGVQDGTEQGVTEGHADTGAAFVPDTDPLTRTDPVDDDSDDDGLLDGTEDADGNGAAVFTLGGTGTSGSGETDPDNSDTDHDGVQDGTERGLAIPEGTDTGPAFRPDLDPASTTDPLDNDTDDGGVPDGNEDADANGRVDAGEIDPLIGADDATSLDNDGDGLTNATEDSNGSGTVDAGETDPFDADSDDDAISDGEEILGAEPTNPLSADSDGDGVQDGTEVGRTVPLSGATDPAVFIPDAEPLTRTDPNDADTDDDGLPDGTEDANHNGKREPATEPDPKRFDTDSDGLSDGLEAGLATAGPDTDPLAFVADADPTTRTSPVDADTDDDGLSDGNEDANHDGAAVFTLGGTGTSGSGETDPNDADTDGDLLDDGLELGLVLPQTAQTALSEFQPDTEPDTTTDPLDDDTDDGGIPDGFEDADQDGDVDQRELDPNFAFDDTLVVDSDGDKLPDGIEVLLHTDPHDKDTDDDGLHDGAELVRGQQVSWVRTNPRNPDTDEDTVQDGTERGVATAPDGDTDPAAFVADANPSTRTDPRDQDTDDDGLSDGDEDLDGDGAAGAGETDPTDIDTDGDGLLDGTEMGLGQGLDDTDPDVFQADLDQGQTLTDPTDDDTDDDGLLDGAEDANHDGVTTHQVGGTGTPGFGELDPTSPDTDGDGLQDGLEVGLVAPQGTGTDPLVFTPDTEPFSATDPNDTDTDNGGVLDGFEDIDDDGLVDAGETNPNDFHDDGTLVDTDGDGLSDAYEDRDLDGIWDPDFGETDWQDADTDDDGLTDGEEVTGALFGGLATLGLVADTDGDGLLDGTEAARAAPVTPDTDLAVFVPDTDPTTRTHPRDDDTDDDGLTDGNEDANHNGATDAGETSPRDRDTDDDRLTDGVEKGVLFPQGNNTGGGLFRHDLDPSTLTDPLRDDTDLDGLLDGTEDANHNGRVDHVLGDTGVVGFGEPDPLVPDTDGDGIADATEAGRTQQEGASEVATAFVADADPSTTTSPVDTDSDDGGVADGEEDANFNGAVDLGELDPNDGIDDLIRVDSDGDLLSNSREDVNNDGVLDPGETDPYDADTDDDGLIDSTEVLGTDPLDAKTDPRNPDTDNDGLFDGQEVGLTASDVAPDTDLLVFVGDGDPSTTTDPLDDDSDDDCLMDGTEDVDQDGLVDVTETDPLAFDSDDDGLGDGVETGASRPEGDGSDISACRPDTDPTTRTDPLVADTDDDLLLDGEEDRDSDGFRDATETDPLLPSTDGDCLLDGEEDADSDGIVDANETDPLSADSDDDGLSDCDEIDAGLDPNAPNGFRGGGGCDTGGAPMGWALLALLPFLVRRRRALVLLAIAPAAWAQDAPQIDIQRFHPIPQVRGYFTVRDAFVDEGTWHAGITGSYALHPFQIGEGSDSIGVVDHLITAEATGSYAILPWLQAGLAFPMIQATGSDVTGRSVADLYGASGKSVGIGDVSLQVTFAPDFRDEHGYGLGIAFTPRFVFPTGSRGALMGSGTFQLGGDVAFGGHWRHLRFSLDVGYMWHAESSAYGNLFPDDELLVGAAFEVPIGEGLWRLGAEWYATSVVAGHGPDEIGDRYTVAENSPMELMATLMWQPPAEMFWMRMGIGSGLTYGYGSPDLRVAVTFAIGRPLQPRDRDGDGIPDVSDTCPDDPEDKDEYQDEEGCPDLDNDGDGVLDVNDGKRSADGTVERQWEDRPFGACMNSPEDPDGFEDGDGCADLDNDGDGVPDVDDGHHNSHGKVSPDAAYPGFGDCMNSAEDLDKFEDGDGCGDPDNDGDGVPDVVDGHREPDGSVREHPYVTGFGDCMDEAEVINGFEDTDGCPDTTNAYVQGTQILLRDQIYFGFDNAVIDPSSVPLLDDLAALLKARPDIVHIEIAGHTSLEGDAKYNQKLSQQRVDAVKQALVDRGIAEGRITSNGYGEERPVVEPERNERDRARNRRVEIRIL